MNIAYLREMIMKALILQYRPPTRQYASEQFAARRHSGNRSATHRKRNADF